MNSSEENVDINSRVGNHNENMGRAQIAVDQFTQEFHYKHPKFDYATADFCHCNTVDADVTVEFDGTLRVLHVGSEGCGKLMLGDDYQGLVFMTPMKARLQHGVLDNGEDYAYFIPVPDEDTFYVKSSFLEGRDCEA